uniref:Uncharacterized protein n=1 Tax=Anguilla anguilla TaxID=7936 RepID=A0A0E9S4S0_ANGAN
MRENYINHNVVMVILIYTCQICEFHMNRLLHHSKLESADTCFWAT